MLVISGNLVLSQVTAPPPGTPLILWKNIVAFGTVTADSEDAEYPITNVANPATDQEWRAASATDVEITISNGGGEILSGVGFARHNFGSAGIQVEIGYYDSSSPPAFVTLAGPQIMATDEPLLFQFDEDDDLDEIVIRLGTGSDAARCAVIYAGQITVMERGVDVGSDFLRPKFARKTEFSAPRSERGDYLGKIVTSQYVDGVEHTYSHLTADFFRDEVDPFIDAAQQDTPFFYAMLSDNEVTYDVGYLWLTDDPQMPQSPVTRRYKLQLKMGGIVE